MSDAGMSVIVKLREWLAGLPEDAASGSPGEELLWPDQIVLDSEDVAELLALIDGDAGSQRVYSGG